jgi:hypothetical protein
MPIISTSIALLQRAERVEPWLICKSDCNDHPPQLRFAVLTSPVRRGGLSSHAGIKASAPFQRDVAASIGKSTN